MEREDEDRRDLRMSLNSVPGNSFELPGAVPTGDQTRFSVGLTHRLTPGLALRCLTITAETTTATTGSDCRWP